MSDAGYTIISNSDIALAAATAKTILSFVGVANETFQVAEISIGFDGTSGSAEPGVVEVCRSTEATAGTSTSQNATQLRGPTRTVRGQGKKNFTAEPTVLTPVKVYQVHPQGTVVIQYPLGREPDQQGAAAIAVRCTFPAAVNVNAAHMEVEEG